MSEANVEIIRRYYETRHGEGGKRREVGLDDSSWERPRPWIALVRRCRSVRCSASSTDRRADDRGRAPRHAVEPAHEGVPLNVIQRQLGHANLGTTSICLQGIENAEIIDTVDARRAPMPLATTALDR